MRHLRDWWFLHRVLREVNLLRSGIAPPLRRLPKGEPARAAKCSVAAALSPLSFDGTVLFVPGSGYVEVWTRTAYDHWKVKVPPILDEFGHRFDQGHFPRLIA